MPIAELFEAYGSLRELEALACDCGCSLEWIEIADPGPSDPAPLAGFELSPAA
ncbi:MAG: hypothetical protein JOZ25_10780 [Actinobacteria bacterium]|nr:hypothetical protein [Actinomycetota bacterium]